MKLCSTTLCPDDHLNIKSIDADAYGNLYAAVKTSKNDASTPNPDDPLIVVYRLNSDGPGPAPPPGRSRTTSPG